MGKGHVHRFVAARRSRVKLTPSSAEVASRRGSRETGTREVARSRPNASWTPASDARGIPKNIRAGRNTRGRVVESGMTGAGKVLATSLERSSPRLRNPCSPLVGSSRSSSSSPLHARPDARPAFTSSRSWLPTPSSRRRRSRWRSSSSRTFTSARRRTPSTSVASRRAHTGAVVGRQGRHRLCVCGRILGRARRNHRERRRRVRRQGDMQVHRARLVRRDFQRRRASEGARQDPPPRWRARRRDRNRRPGRHRRQTLAPARRRLRSRHVPREVPQEASEAARLMPANTLGVLASRIAGTATFCDVARFGAARTRLTSSSAQMAS